MLRTRMIRTLWSVAILAVLATALMPVPEVPALPSNVDKLVHLLCYLVLGMLAVLAQRRVPQRAAAAVAMVALGMVIELAQGRLPWRSFEWADIVANTLGVSIGAVAALILLRRGPATQKE
jgi:VanZ family protein